MCGKVAAGARNSSEPYIPRCQLTPRPVGPRKRGPKPRPRVEIPKRARVATGPAAKPAGPAVEAPERAVAPPERAHARPMPATAVRPPAQPVAADGLIDDRLLGAKAIAQFLYGGDDVESVKLVYAEVAKGLIPAGRWGGRLIASKQKILARYDTITSGNLKGN